MSINVKPNKLLVADTFEHPAVVLKRNTLQYWILNTVVHGRIGNVEISVGQAIKETRELKEVISPKRPLSVCVENLSQKLIEGTPRRKKKTKQPNNIVSCVFSK